MALADLLDKRSLPPDTFARLAFWSEPLAEAFVQDSTAFDRPMMVAMAGPPNSGKDIFGEFVAEKLTEIGCRAVHIRVTDFCLGFHARERIAEAVHPLLIHRGLPGTHDIPELRRVLETLRSGALSQPLHIPRFDKSTDVRASFSRWQVIRDVPKIVITTGWTLGAIAQESGSLTRPLNDAERRHDHDGTWRRAVNDIIRNDYQPLYSLFDRWVYGKPPSFESVRGWIMKDHQSLLRKMDQKGLEITNETRRWGELFSQLSERVSRDTINRLAVKCDYLLTMNDERRVTSFTRQRVV